MHFGIAICLAPSIYGQLHPYGHIIWAGLMPNKGIYIRIHYQMVFIYMTWFNLQIPENLSMQEAPGHGRPARFSASKTKN